MKDADLGSFLDKLGGAIAGKQVSTLDVKVPFLPCLLLWEIQWFCQFTHAGNDKLQDTAMLTC